MGLKNAVGVVPTLGTVVDFAVNESCEQYSECGAYRPMLNASKAVLHIEYKGPISKVCADRPARFSTILKNRDLDPAILGRC